MNHQISLCLSSEDQCDWRRAVYNEVNLSRKDHCVKMEVIIKEIKGGGKEEKQDLARIPDTLPKD